ncbi:MAG: type II toxin-antitoxin system prevent-host-death family antitoxin [Deltaproteobacteria bacterium]|nr:type II toxin-antitoxin system prevent-host-death family antitoxin [Deltaproteobacteria bacterium]
MAHTYSIYEAKAKLSEVLRMVKKGQETVITERGTPIAKVVPFKEKTASTLDERLKELEARGLVRRSRKSASLPSPIPRPGALKRFLADRE